VPEYRTDSLGSGDIQTATLLSSIGEVGVIDRAVGCISAIHSDDLVSEDASEKLLSIDSPHWPID
jgi:hypothetical protein